MSSLLSKLEKLQDTSGFRGQHWEGTFEQYLDLVRADPTVTRTAFQRLYDMIVSYGSEDYARHRETLIHYRFFDDPFENGKDAVFGLDKPLMELVRIFQLAARRYGSERRVILLHVPVGTSISTLVRLLKKGMETYTRTETGRLSTFYWQLDDGEWLACLMAPSEGTGLQLGIQPFAGPGPRVQVSREGGTQPRWSHDGKRLFFIAPDRKLMEVEIDVRGDRLRPGVPRPLFQTRIVSPNFVLFQYDVTGDASRFLINSLKPEAPLTLVSNWPRALRQ